MFKYFKINQEGSSKNCYRWKNKMANNQEEVVSATDESLTIELGTPDRKTVYLKFPDGFKDGFEIRTAIPILSTVTREKEITKLCFYFSNDTLKQRTKKIKEENK